MLLVLEHYRLRETNTSAELTQDDQYQHLLKALHLKTDKLSAKEFLQLKELLGEYQHAFVIDNSELSSTSLAEHHIDTGHSKPYRQHPRRILFAQCEKMDGMVQEMLEQGVVQPSQSSWASPVVTKHDGTMRFCVDYRCLNSITKTDVFPLP